MPWEWEEDWTQQGDCQGDCELREEYAYWLSYADGVINQEPEPGEDEAAELKENPGFMEEKEDPSLAEGVEEAVALYLGYGEWAGGNAGQQLLHVLTEVEGHAGNFEETLARVKLHQFRLVLGEQAPELVLLKGVPHKGEMGKAPQEVTLTKGDLKALIEEVLELYQVDFPDPAYQRIKAFLKELEQVSWEHSELMESILDQVRSVWDHLNFHPNLHVPVKPWESPELLKEQVKIYRLGVLSLLKRRGLALSGALQRALYSDDIYELVAIRMLVKHWLKI